MYLEKIEIIGFKSFADKTTINFSKPVTAIVGPNGCGKSNVVDAFRWVLGGPSAKSLRSEKMVDVIFSGTEKRKPLNYAQISLTFTNTDKKLSVDFQEICISRRLYRSGESEYHINRNPVRLKDIHKLLWEAGLGKNAFYIFEQGKIDELITSSPEERRNIFEEAAKIMHFKEKRREAFRKLAQVEANLKRVFDIQGEVNKQIETLKKQAEEAKIYKEQKSSLENLSKDLVIAKWQENNKKQLSLEKELENKAKEEKELKEKVTSANEMLKSLRESEQQKAIEAKASYEKFFEAKKSKELASFEFKNHQKKLEELFRQKNVLRNKLQAFHQKHLEEHKIYLGNQNLLKSHDTNLSQLTNELNDALVLIQDLEEKVNQESVLRKESQQELLKVVGSENQLGFNYKNTINMLETTQEKLSSIHKEESQSFSKLQEKKQALDALSEREEQTKSQLDSLVDNLKLVSSQIVDKESSLIKIKEHLNNLSGQITSKSAKVNLLQKLKDELDGYGKGAKALLQYSKDKSHTLYDKISPLTEWIIPQKGYEVCLSSLLGPYLQTLIVKTKDDLEFIIKEAEDKNLIGFSILCLEDLGLENNASNQKIAQSNLISSHFLNHISEEEAFIKNLKKETLIEKKYFLDQKMVLHKLSGDSNNLFLRETELRNHYKELLLLEKEHEELKGIYQNENTSFINLKEKDSLLNKENHKLKMELVEIEMRLKNLSEEIKNIEEKSKEQQSKKGELVTALENLNAKQKEISLKYEAEKLKKIELENNFKKIERQFETNFSQLKENRSLKQSLDERIKKIEREAQNLQEHIKIFESKSSDFEDQIEKMNFEINENESLYQKLEEESLIFIEQEKILKEKLVLADKHYHSFEDELEGLEKAQKELDLKLSEMRTLLEQMQEADIEINNKKAEVQAENKLYFDKITEEYELSKESLPEYEIEPDFSIYKSEKEVRRLKKSLEGFTEINLKAVADCREQEERFTLLQSQVEDLSSSKEKLIEIVTELDNTSRQMFSETFENIRTHFRNNYALLFNGGEADLQLTSPDDILESGIEITAQPPGKKMRSIQQLSGGEKCLTAVALLFALFETQSIPFCILDEIDAPLDDTNVERFTKVLKQFVKNHQFIIITHNKRTMAMADVLLGISMEEKGVTKVIPFQFNNEPKANNSEALV